MIILSIPFVIVAVVVRCINITTKTVTVCDKLMMLSAKFLLFGPIQNSQIP